LSNDNLIYIKQTNINIEYHIKLYKPKLMKPPKLSKTATFMRDLN